MRTRVGQVERNFPFHEIEHSPVISASLWKRVTVARNNIRSSHRMFLVGLRMKRLVAENGNARLYLFFFNSCARCPSGRGINMGKTKVKVE